MATHNFIPRSNYTIVVITLCFFHLIFYTVTATNIINNINGGFSAHLIRKNSPNSPFREHKNQKVSRRLIGSDIPEAPIRIDNEESLEHIMKLSVGTPPFDVYLIADTGSDLLWTQCEPCKNCYKSKFATFDPRQSSTYENITCQSRECRVLLKEFAPQVVDKCRANPTRNCPYQYSYADKAYTVGHLGKETISLNSTKGEVVALKNIVFGCGVNNKENSDIMSYTGLIGLGRGSLSFVSQIGPYVGGKKFSHCFVSDFKSDSKIYFGKGSEVLGEGVVTVPLVVRKDDPNKYFVTVTGMSIGNDFVLFNSNGTTTVKKGNMMIDSGTPTPRLPQEMFDQVATQLKKTIPSSSFLNEEKFLCFDNTTTPFKAPTMALHFEDGAKLPLFQEAMFQQEENGATCFSAFSTTNEDSGFIGGLQQINQHVGFDLERNVVSFKPTNCADHIKSN